MFHDNKMVPTVDFSHIWSDHEFNLWSFVYILPKTTETSIVQPAQFKQTSYTVTKRLQMDFLTLSGLAMTLTVDI